MRDATKARFYHLSDVTLHAVEAGPKAGPLTILLHGFPEFWWAWRHYIDPLAKAGIRVLAPDQRGYNLSSKPPSIAAYHLDKLAADVVGLITACQRDRATLVGHDWGGIVGGRVAVRYPSRVEKLVMINAPHWPTAAQYIRRHPGQMLKSAYVGFFQIPVLPEILLQRGDYAPLSNTMVRSSRAGTFGAEDFAQYRRAWRQRGALRAMLNWYRALARAPGEGDGRQIEAPSVLVWGKKDAFLQPGLAEATLERCKDGRLICFEEGTHWVHDEEADAVSEIILKLVKNT